MEATFVIIGGGIAGVTCAETLAFLESEESIILISESALIKTVRNLHAITRTLTEFNIEEKHASFLSTEHLNITVIHDSVKEINEVEHFVVTLGKKVKYKYLCLCMGAEPLLIPQASTSPYILGIRDTDSVENFISTLKKARRIVIVGNGGIASELVFKISNIEVQWVIKDRHITATFIDPGAAEFFQPTLKEKDGNSFQGQITKRMRYDEEGFKLSGAALGPDWYRNLIISGCADLELPQVLKIHYETEVTEVVPLEKTEYPIEVVLTNGERIPCDLVVSATGVTARSNIKTQTPLGKFQNSIQVNEFMQTSLPDIYAAGDVCNANWPLAKHWFQMKLWTQARQMGCYAAKSMSGHFRKEVVLQDFCFEMFSHSTKLFGYKVILLGLFNGQKLGTNCEILLRMTRGKEYIKFILENGRLQGAVLIGETDLEEMAENLILNQLDLSPFGDDILNPDIDIDDYFD